MQRRTKKERGKPSTVLLVGYAKLPEETAAQSVYGTIGLALEVESATGTVVSASCTLVPPTADEFVSGILTGVRLSDGIDSAVAEITARYLGPAQNAIIAALRAAYDRWRAYHSGEE